MTNYKPLANLFYLLLACSIGILVIGGMGMLIALAVNHWDALTIDKLTTTIPVRKLWAMRILQSFVHMGAFLMPSLWLIHYRSLPVFKKRIISSKRNDFLLVLLLVVSVIPLMEFVYTVNQQIVLPHFLQGLQNWMKAKEIEADTLVKVLLYGTSYSVVIANVVMVAVLPALGEELFFRGCLQKMIDGWLNNHHRAIWITAVIFSAIHLQFYGFFPRLLLGAMFGYLYHWTKNIWVPILAHFVNNLLGVVSAFVYSLSHADLTQMENSFSIPWYIILISMLLGIYLFFLIYTNSLEIEDGICLHKEE